MAEAAEAQHQQAVLQLAREEEEKVEGRSDLIKDTLSKVAKTITEGLKESNKMFVELEEKRMKFEEQQKREDRQLQLQMMRLL